MKLRKSVDNFASKEDIKYAIKTYTSDYCNPIGRSDGVITARSQGFFTNFQGVLGILDYCEKKHRVPVVKFDKGLFLDPERGSNWWEYYFEPVSDIDPFSIDTRGFPKLEWENRHSFYARDRLSRNAKHELINRYIKIKPHILGKVDAFSDRHFKNHYVIGVHLRGTDKREDAIRLPIKFVTKQIDLIIKEKSRYRIFVATDERQYLESLKAIYGDRVIYSDAIRSDASTGLHFRTDIDPYRKGEDALIDCLLLSRTNFLLACTSNLSHTALDLNPVLQYKHLTRLYRSQPEYIIKMIPRFVKSQLKRSYGKIMRLLSTKRYLL